MPAPPLDKSPRRGFRSAGRLIGAAQFGAVRREGRRARSKQIELAWLPQSDAQRLGFVVGRQVGGAVVRNRLRRVCREWFRLQRGSIPAGDWVLRLFPAAAAASTQLLWNDLTRLAQSVTTRP